MDECQKKFDAAPFTTHYMRDVPASIAWVLICKHCPNYQRLPQEIFQMILKKLCIPGVYTRPRIWGKSLEMASPGDSVDVIMCHWGFEIK